MVKRCHRTLQSVIVKVMEQQGDWYKLLNSVHFGMCCYTHSPTRLLAMRMLYKKDPIMPLKWQTNYNMKIVIRSLKNPMALSSCQKIHVLMKVTRSLTLFKQCPKNEKKILKLLIRESSKLKNIRQKVIMLLVQCMLLVPNLRLV